MAIDVRFVLATRSVPSGNSRRIAVHDMSHVTADCDDDSCAGVCLIVTSPGDSDSAVIGASSVSPTVVTGTSGYCVESGVRHVVGAVVVVSALVRISRSVCCCDCVGVPVGPCVSYRVGPVTPVGSVPDYGSCRSLSG